MGLMLTAQCPCGIDTQVFSGSGGAGPSTACLPAWCKACSRIVTALTEQGPTRCEDCQPPVQVIHLYEPTGLVEHPPEGPVPCPRCGHPTLQFTPTGIWD